MVPGGLLRITIPPPFSPLSHSTQMSSLHKRNALSEDRVAMDNGCTGALAEIC